MVKRVCDIDLSSTIEWFISMRSTAGFSCCTRNPYQIRNYANTTFSALVLYEYLLRAVDNQLCIVDLLDSSWYHEKED